MELLLEANEFGHATVQAVDEDLKRIQSVSTQKERARKYRKKLQARQAFIMPEAWDVPSARVLAHAGFAIVGVSSTAVAWSRGYRLDERLSLDELLDITGRIAKGFGVPVNADLEGALDRSPEEIGAAVSRALAMGCIGVTLGDGGRNGLHGVAPVDEMTASIRAARAAAVEAAIPAVITASTEAYLIDSPGRSPFEMTVERAEAYFAAGADCVLVPGVQHLQVLERLTAMIDAPLAITIGATHTPNVRLLARAGIACVTLGCSMMRSMLGSVRYKAEELQVSGHFGPFDNAIPANQLDGLLRSCGRRARPDGGLAMRH
jgi:2-methylisocitrate lyase-like PEP mutase family enzyme